MCSVGEVRVVCETEKKEILYYYKRLSLLILIVLVCAFSLIKELQRFMDIVMVMVMVMVKKLESC